MTINPTYGVGVAKGVTIETWLGDPGASHAQGGRLSSKGHLYDLERYDLLVETLRPAADQRFFDKDGNLWFLTTADGVLEEQALTH